jgi:hypothetical protein
MTNPFQLSAMSPPVVQGGGGAGMDLGTLLAVFQKLLKSKQQPGTGATPPAPNAAAPAAAPAPGGTPVVTTPDVMHSAVMNAPQIDLGPLYADLARRMAGMGITPMQPAQVQPGGQQMGPVNAGSIAQMAVGGGK